MLSGVLRSTGSKLGEHDQQLDEIFEALRQLITPPPAAQAPGRFQVA